jgi:hypothetical protein
MMVPGIVKNVMLKGRRKARLCGISIQFLTTCRRPTPSSGLRGAVVAAVLSRMITVEEVCQRYGLSVDEFLSRGTTRCKRRGLQGLRTTKLQNYRYSRPKRD